MIITRTPFRVTLGGGGTDLPSYYREHGGFVLAVAIDKYMYLNVNTPIVDDFIRVQYSKTEIVSHADEVQHTLVREALRSFHIDNGIEIVSMADIPAGTGLGSSSCYLVGLLNALHTLTRTPVSTQGLAEEACCIELERLQKPIGKQDQYMAAFGALTVLEIAKDGQVMVSHPELSMELVDALESNILLFYTGAARDAVTILQKQDSAAKRKDKEVVESLHEIRDIGMEIRQSIAGGNLRRFGELLDVHWQTKKRLSDGISNRQIDDWYELAKKHGAIGGKISGAGGGGFLMLYCEENKPRLREAMRRAGLLELALQLLLRLAEAVGGAVAAQLGFELRARLVEALRLALLHFVQSNDVVAELRLHRPTDLAHGHTEECIAERPDEAAAFGPAEIATVLCRARILRVLLGELREILAGLGLREHLLRLLASGCLVLAHGNQDVPSVPLLGHLEAVFLFVISGAQIGIVHRLLRGQLVQTQLRILKARRLEAGLPEWRHAGMPIER